MKTSFLLIVSLALVASLFSQSPSSKIDSAYLGIQRTQSSEVDTPKKAVEIMPEFPGGEEGLFKYLINNLNYPDKAIKKRTEGTVYLQFVVSKDGKVRDIEVLRGVSQELDNEAVRVIREMPTWKPGSHEGEVVSVYFAIPIKFRL